MKSLDAFYYACSYAKADYSKFRNATAGIALKLVPQNLISQPVFLCIDDTMAAKPGTKFEDVSKLFDHAAHNGSNYLNGHCFLFMTFHHSGQEKGDGLHRMGKGSPFMKILHCLMKKLTITIWLRALCLQIFLAEGKSLPV